MVPEVSPGRYTGATITCGAIGYPALYLKAGDRKIKSWPPAYDPVVLVPVFQSDEKCQMAHIKWKRPDPGPYTRPSDIRHSVEDVREAIFQKAAIRTVCCPRMPARPFANRNVCGIAVSG